MRSRLTALLIIVTFCGGVRQSEARTAEREITVAAAANLMQVLQDISADFEKQTRIHAVLSFGSTAVLTSQIENSAPFDVFLAADAEHVEKLASEHLLVAASAAVYATGVLALWIPAGTKVKLNAVRELAQANVHVIAVANPKLAPYGTATVETLQHAGIWDRVKDRIVYAENISMSKQYGISGNADAVFTAYSLVFRDKGKVISVPESMHAPIVQKLGVLASSQHKEAAQSFAEFVLYGPGRATLARYGYKVQ